MQGGWHIDALEVSVGAAESDVSRPPIGVDRLQESAQRNTAPLANRAPALNAHQTGDLVFLRQPPQPRESPGLLVANLPGML